ncbi:uncharacterized protein LOC131245003 [Magnolia sinica]|uniref:uncharacterized protein LOC131245003 n=1 Tax=Magnolia sinica TaxID=86752 RepID=UPI002659DD4E|nr:uncharacterized protein LOC131245003 [Magnolia sinica]
MPLSPSHCRSLSFSLPLSADPFPSHSIALPLALPPSLCRSLSLPLLLRLRPSPSPSPSLSLPLPLSLKTLVPSLSISSALYCNIRYLSLRSIYRTSRSILLQHRGFDIKLINVNRTCKVTKGGQVVKYTAMLAGGNYHGVVGFAKGKAQQFPLPSRRYLFDAFVDISSNLKSLLIGKSIIYG